MSDIEKHEHDGSESGEQDTAPQYTGLKGIYYKPITQVVILALVCFMCPGLYNALTGIGGGGQVDETTQANASSALNATFAFCSFLAGTINNKLGSRLTLQIGTIGYSLYIGSYLALNIHPGSKAFVIAAGAILGICAGLLWTAQGSLMLAYPTESQKGMYIAIFWAIFNLGGVLGGAISFGQNFDSTTGTVKNSTYEVFLVLTCIGFVLPMTMVDPKKMRRTDGSRIVMPRHPSWKTEIKGLWYTLRDDRWIVLLFPLFFASNWFYTWQFNDYNGVLFDIRTRALNSTVYWAPQIFGALGIGMLLDKKGLSRRARGFAGWVSVFIFVFIVHIWAYFYQKNYTRESVAPASGYVPIDLKDSAYPARVWLYIFMGLLDSMWQTLAYWIMGAISNDPAKLAFLTGFYKSIQSAGAAGVWRADGVGIPFMNIFISTWVLCIAGLLFALPVMYMRIKNHTDIEDETIARMDDKGHIQPVSKFVGERDRD